MIPRSGAGRSVSAVTAQRWRRTVGLSALGGGAVALVQAAPVVSAIRPLRVAVTPGLSGLGQRDKVAITFDDGPDPASTPKFLDLLATSQVKATFFLLGFMVRRAPASLVRDIVAAGHEVGVHGTEHRNLLFRGPLATRNDLACAKDLIGDITGSDPLWYRPPYGILTTPAALAARSLQMRPVLWTTWGWDWTRWCTPASVQRSVFRHLTGGATVLLHDADCTSAPGSWRATLGALPGILQACQRRGWTPVGLSAHLGRHHARPPLGA